MRAAVEGTHVRPVRTFRPRTWNDSGAIEGLPLQLMIMVVVAGVALAIILGWVLSIPTPNVIRDVRWSVRYADGSSRQTVDVPSGEGSVQVDIAVSAYDQRGNAIVGVSVTLNGAGVSQKTRVDGADDPADGTAVFPAMQVLLPSESGPASISVVVQKSGYPPSTTQSILVRHP